MYESDLSLNNPSWLICHKTVPNQTKPNQTHRKTNKQECKVIFIQQISPVHFSLVDFKLFKNFLNKPFFLQKRKNQLFS